MKTSTILSLIFAVLLAISTTSCNKDEVNQTHTTQLIEGEWRFSSVKFRPDFSLTSQNYTSDYAGINLIFHSDKVLEQVETSSGISETGNWEIETIWVMLDDQTIPLESLKGDMNDLSGQPYSFEWHSLEVSNNKITATEERNGGTYTYKMVRD